MKNIDDDIAYGNYIIKCYTDIQQQLYILVDNQAIIKNEYTLDEIELKDIETIYSTPLIKRIHNKSNEQ
jgi:hypothetical protein